MSSQPWRCPSSPLACSSQSRQSSRFRENSHRLTCQPRMSQIWKSRVGDQGVGGGQRCPRLRSEDLQGPETSQRCAEPPPSSATQNCPASGPLHAKRRPQMRAGLGWREQPAGPRSPHCSLQGVKPPSSVRNIRNAFWGSPTYLTPTKGFRTAPYSSALARLNVPEEPNHLTSTSQEPPNTTCLSIY